MPPQSTIIACVAASSKLTPFREVNQIPKNIIASGSKDIVVRAISYNQRKDELFVLDDTGTVRAIRPTAPNTRKNNQIIYTNKYENMEMATFVFVNQAQSLIICVKKKRMNTDFQIEYRLLCLRQNGNQWVEQSNTQIKVDLHHPYHNVSLHEFQGSTAVLLVPACSRKVVRVEIASQKFGRVTQIDTDNRFLSYCNAAVIERNGTTFVAYEYSLSPSHGNAVYLCALQENSLVSLSKIEVALNERWTAILSINNQLVAAKYNDSGYSIVALDTNGGQLAISAELLPAAAGINPAVWCAAGKDRIILWDLETRNLIVYTFV